MKKIEFYKKNFQIGRKILEQSKKFRSCSKKYLKKKNFEYSITLSRDEKILNCDKKIVFLKKKM